MSQTAELPIVEPRVDFPPPRAPRYRSLDMWRGVACIFVVFYHSTLIHCMHPPASDGAESSAEQAAGIFCQITNYLWIGVPMFFVISGYCISATADSSRRKPAALKNYFIRRFRRIFPPYWAAILFCIVFLVLIDLVIAPRFLSEGIRPQARPWWFSPSQWIGNLTLTETWRHYFFGDTRAHFVGQSWTLCYEEQFYAVTGLLLLLSPRYFFHGAAVVTGLTLIASATCRAYDVPIQGFFFDGAWLMFAVGIIVYYAVNYGSPPIQLALILLLTLAVAATFYQPDFFFKGSTSAFLFALVLVLLHPWDAHLCRFAVLRPLFYFGTICYSLYLVHALLVRAVSKTLFLQGWNSHLATVLLTIPLCVGVSVLLGGLFYQFVEKRFLNPPQKITTTLPTSSASTSP